MTCPLVISDDAVDGIIMGASGSEAFVIDINEVWRYTFPALVYVETLFSSQSVTWPAPFGLSSQNSFIGTYAAATIGPDGKFYCWLFDNGSQDTAVVRIEADGSNPTILYLVPTPPTGLAYGMITWHPATPDVVWCTFFDTDAGTYDLFTIDRSTGSRTNKLNLDAYTTPPAHTLNQYDTGLVFPVGSGGSFGTLVAYDVVSDTSDTLSTPSVRGLGTYWSEHQVLWNALFSQADAVDIDNSGSVSLANGTTDCDAWDAEGLYASPYLWFSPHDRSHVYVSDGSYVWDLNPVTGGLRVGHLRMRPT